MANPVVLLATEGTYPYALGGVSTWCNTLVRDVSGFDFIIFAVVMNPYVQAQFPTPPSVRKVINVPLWGTQDPSEHRDDIPFSEIFLQKQRTTPSQVAQSFLPIFEPFLDELLTQGANPEKVGHACLAMYRYFRFYDYRDTFKCEAVWNAFTRWIRRGAELGRWPEPTIFETVQALGWIYHFLIVLNTSIPEVDVVHSSAAAFCGLTGIVAKLSGGTPFLLTEHGVYLREQYLSVGRSNMSRFSKRFLISVVSTIVRANFFFADEVLPVCAFNARWERRMGVPKERIQVIYNGVSPELFTPSQAPAPSHHVLSVARMDPNKDVATLLRAIAIVRQRIPEVKVTVAGAISVPDYHERMLALRRELGLEDTVTFAGHTENVQSLYTSATLMVQTSVSEAFPYSVIEAMMSGIPVVATDVGGTREALLDGGFVVPSRNPERVALAIITLLENPALRLQFAEAARERALNHFTIDLMARNYQSRYRRTAPLTAPAAAALAVATGAREHQKLLLEKSFALRRLGQPVAALDQLTRALRLAPSSPSAPALLQEIAELEQALGQPGAAALHLVGAWMLDKQRPA